MDISKLNLEQIKKIIKKAKKIDVVNLQKLNDIISKFNLDVEIANSDLEAILNPPKEVKKGQSMTAKEFQTLLEKNNEVVYAKTETIVKNMIGDALEKNNKVVYAKMDEKFTKIDERFNKIDHRLDGIEGRLTNLEKDMIEVKADIKAIKNTPTMKKELGL